MSGGRSGLAGVSSSQTAGIYETMESGSAYRGDLGTMACTSDRLWF